MRTYATLKELIIKTARCEEYPKIQKLIILMQNAKKRGYLNKDEFIKICKEKTPRPEKHYKANPPEAIKEISKRVFESQDDLLRMNLLLDLKGVGIAVGSWMLMMIDPQNYGTIDIRAWQVLVYFNEVSTKSNGKNLGINDWHLYNLKLRAFANELKLSARDIERTLYDFHPKIQTGTLY